jgi:hypothetical protein
VNEDLVKQIAAALTAKLLDQPQRTKSQFDGLLLVADSADLAAAQAITDQTSVRLSTICLASLNTERETEFLQQCAQTPLIVISHPSLTLVSQLAYLQLDNPKIKAILDALNQKKRVVMLLNGVFATYLSTTLTQAIGQLQQKLQSLGIEFCLAEQLVTVLSSFRPTIAQLSPHNPSVTLNTLPNTQGACSCHQTTSLTTPTSQPPVNHPAPLPIYQHPSQYQLSNTVAALVDFMATKPCTMEKGKLCDNCDICNTLGF